MFASFPCGLIAQRRCDINVRTVLSVQVQALLRSVQSRPDVPIFPGCIIFFFCMGLIFNISVLTSNAVPLCDYDIMMDRHISAVL